MILKSQQRFESKRHNVLTKEIHNIGLSWNYDKRLQSIDFAKTHICGTSKNLLRLKEKTKCGNVIKQ